MSKILSNLLHRWISEAVDLVLPSYCAGCNQPETLLCPECLAHIQALKEPLWVSPHADALPLMPTNFEHLDLQASEQELPVLPVYAATIYKEQIAGIILNIKDHSKPQLCVHFGPAFERTIAQAQNHLSQAPPILVPIPATRASLIKRGYWPLQEFYRHVRAPSAMNLLQPDPNYRVKGSQKQRTKAERAALLKGSLKMNPKAPTLKENTEVVLLDDVLTTGATLAEGYRVLTEAGLSVVAAAVVAATMPATTLEETGANKLWGESEKNQGFNS